MGFVNHNLMAKTFISIFFREDSPNLREKLLLFRFLSRVQSVDMGNIKLCRSKSMTWLLAFQRVKAASCKQWHSWAKQNAKLKILFK